MTAALCLDLGGTNFRAALAQVGREGDAAVLGHWPAPEDLASFQRLVAGLIDAHTVSRVGIAVPGLASGSTCLWAPNLPYLDGQDLALVLPGITVTLGNDAHFALLAEAALGAARNAADVILLAIGTGTVRRCSRMDGSYMGAAARRPPSDGPAPIRPTPATTPADGSSATRRERPSTQSAGGPD
jgi:hypothetical protein